MQGAEANKQMGIFFMAEADAQALIEKVTVVVGLAAGIVVLSIATKPWQVVDTSLLWRPCVQKVWTASLSGLPNGQRLKAEFSVTMQLKKEHPKLGKQSQIWTLTMDKVYATFGVSAPEQTQNVCFRFLPDMKQVNNAMAVSPSGSS